MRFTQNRNLLAIGLFVDVVLVILFGYCLVLGIYVATLEPTPVPAEPAPIVEEQFVVATPAPSRTPPPTLTPGPTPTITLIPTLPDTATPTNAVVEPTRVPYVFPNPLVVPAGSPATPAPTRPVPPSPTPKRAPPALPSPIPAGLPTAAGPQ
ncbi:MAG: hypothetical protein M1482_04810 [Chloroflexi bacterium]|nr:hypothetical protein [Chloroflexota bacterium]